MEREIDNLPVDARYRERKLHDMTLRLDGLYDTLVELEERIEDAKLRRNSIEMEAIRDGKEVRKILWESGNTVETVVLMSKKDCFLQLHFYFTTNRFGTAIRGKSEALLHADVRLIIVQAPPAQFATKRGAGQGSSKIRYFKKLLLCSSACRL